MFDDEDDEGPEDELDEKELATYGLSANVDEGDDLDSDDESPSEEDDEVGAALLGKRAKQQDTSPDKG